MNDTMTLRALAEVATPGTWFDDYGKVGADDHGIGEMDVPEDAAYIVALVNAAPALLDRLDVLEALLATGVDIATRQSADLDGAQRLNRDLFAIVGEAAVETGRGPWPTNGGERTYLAVPAIIKGEPT